MIVVFSQRVYQVHLQQRLAGVQSGKCSLAGIGGVRRHLGLDVFDVLVEMYSVALKGRLVIDLERGDMGLVFCLFLFLSCVC